MTVPPCRTDARAKPGAPARLRLPALLLLLCGVLGAARAQPAAPAPTDNAAAAVPAASAEPPPAAPGTICDTGWFRSGARTQMEADGDMPMSITMTIRHPVRTETGCSAWLTIHSKSALAAMMGPPVVMDQVHHMNFDRAAGGTGGTVSSQRATINARARYTRLFGEASFQGHGVLSYAGLAVREGAVLPGETLTSSLDLEIHSLATDAFVTTIRAPSASVTIGERRVGRARAIETTLGRRECMPITYEKRNSLGPVLMGDEVIQTEPAVMEITDWYCPTESFVLRTEVRQKGKVETIDTTALGLLGDDQP
ncbi:hypothetical protein [Cupriavidus sp. WS]|uniref:hypothetical protein n=1 Tax=Cupriavidus sp. WS TaxID=1312922 RepID=UPI00068A7C9F|nr:hypothetical protein [Cupriavidus sp. WS]